MRNHVFLQACFFVLRGGIMARDFAKEFYRSTAWRKTRAYIFNKEHGICQRCHGANGPGEIVHHKIYLTPSNIHNPAITLGEDNLELLCRVCHALEHESELPTDKCLMFDEEGNLVERSVDNDYHSLY